MILLSFEDISRYKIAEKSLMETQEQLELALVGGSVGTWSWNIRNNEIKISKEGQALYGLTEGVCRTYDEWEQLIYPDDLAPTREALKRSIEKKLPLDIEFRIIRPDKSTRRILLKANTYYGSDGRAERIVGVKIDITDRIDLERQKDDFMGIASHELKTPVTSIKAYTQILQEKFRKANDVVSANMLTRLDLQIDKLTGLINTLLDVARIQSGQMDYEESYFDISEFILEVTEEMQRTSQDHTIVTDLSVSGKVFGDKERITQVLTNLISNAVKYSPSSTKVFVRTQRDDSNFIICVQDFGVGISKEMQDKIFGRFFRVSESAGNRASGLGLGLFISSEIVKQHGGKLWLESEPGKGSKFFFSLPDKSE